MKATQRKKKHRITPAKKARARIRELCAKVRSLESQIDTLTRQRGEVLRVNHQNAHAHRATEVAMLMQNNRLQAAEARLAGRPVHPELAAAVESLAPPVIPKRIPVPEPKEIASPK